MRASGHVAVGTARLEAVGCAEHVDTEVWFYVFSTFSNPVKIVDNVY